MSNWIDNEYNNEYTFANSIDTSDTSKLITNVLIVIIIYVIFSYIISTYTIKTTDWDECDVIKYIYIDDNRENGGEKVLLSKCNMGFRKILMMNLYCPLIMSSIISILILKYKMPRYKNYIYTIIPSITSIISLLLYMYYKPKSKSN